MCMFWRTCSVRNALVFVTGSADAVPIHRYVDMYIWFLVGYLAVNRSICNFIIAKWPWFYTYAYLRYQLHSDLAILQREYDKIAIMYQHP